MLLRCISSSVRIEVTNRMGISGPTCCRTQHHLRPCGVLQVPVHDEQVEALALQAVQQLRSGQVGVAAVAHGVQGLFEKTELKRIVV